MRILYLHQYFVSPSTHGGTRSYEFARRWIDKGHDVRIITSTAMLPPEYQAIEKTTTFEIEGIPVTAIPVAYSNQLSFSQRILSFLRFAILSLPAAMRHKADVIFATSTPLTIALPALAARFWQRKPMVFEVRDLWPDVPVAMGALSNPVFRWLAKFLEIVTYRSAAHIIALSPGMKEGIENKGIHTTKITVAPNSSDNNLFEVPDENGLAIRHQLGIQADDPLILYAGTFGMVNDLDYLVKVAAEMKQINSNVYFLLVGKGIEKDKITETAQQLEVLDQNLFIWNPVPKEKLPDLYSAATVATSTVAKIKILEHNSANKVFDTMAAGKPVVINHGGWLADTLNQQQAGLVLPKDNTQQAAQMLVDLFNDQDRYDAMCRASKELADTEFDRDVISNRVLAILESFENSK